MGLVANGLPSILYRMHHGPSPATDRRAWEAEYFGMKIVQLLLPVDAPSPARAATAQGAVQRSCPSIWRERGDITWIGRGRRLPSAPRDRRVGSSPGAFPQRSTATLGSAQFIRCPLGNHRWLRIALRLADQPTDSHVLSSERVHWLSFSIRRGAPPRLSAAAAAGARALHASDRSRPRLLDQATPGVRAVRSATTCENSRTSPRRWSSMGSSRT